MKNNQPKKLVVILNNEPVLEYDRCKALSHAQHKSLEMMDQKLDQGITLEGKFIEAPSLEQRIEFIAAHMITAILSNDEVLSAAGCAYLAKVLPELKQVKSIEKDDEISIELIFDREYQEELRLSFTPMVKLRDKHH